MNKATKLICLIAAGLIAVGLAMACFGFFAGGNAGNFDLLGNVFNGGWGHGSAFDSVYDESWAKGGEVTEPFHSVELDVNYQSVRFLPGDGFSVEYHYRKQYSKVEHELINGVLTVKETDYDQKSTFFDRFWESKRVGSVRITYPKDTKFETIHVRGGLTEIQTEDLTAESLALEIELGDISVSDTYAESLSIDAGAGDVKLKNVTCKDTEFACGLGDLETEGFVCGNKLLATLSAGELHLAGDITGVAKLACELGDIQVKLDRPQAEYSYEVDTELGEVWVNGDTKGRGTDKVGGHNKLEISGSAGDIELDFQ